MKNLYLVAYYFKKPHSPRVRTNVAGWQQVSGSTVFDEQVQLTNRLRNRDLTMAAVILDLIEQKVIRNGYHSQGSYQQLYDYYYKEYAKELDQISSQIRQ